MSTITYETNKFDHMDSFISSPAIVTCPNDTSCQRNMVHSLSQLPSLAGGFVCDI